MTAQELFAALDRLPGARRVPVGGDGLEESRLVGPVEVARARSGGERELRRAWRERQGGRPDPLLVLADDDDHVGALRALGPVNAGAPVRIVSAGELLRVLETLPARSSLQAVRSLAEELERLDAAGVAGLTVRGLTTEHLLAVRLRGDTRRWAELADAARDLPRGDWREVLTALGYALERQPARNHLARYGGRPVAVVRPFADAADFARLDRDGRPPEGVLLEDCLAAGAPYGLLVSGSRLRLFAARPDTGSAVARYLEVDASALPDEDRPLLGLLAPAMLAEGGFGALLAEADRFGAGLRRRLDLALRQRVLPGLGLELGRWAREEGIELADDGRREELEAAALTWVFRALFLLYAESAGYLPVAQEAYRPHSFSQLVQDAAQMERKGADRRAASLWDRTALLVRAMRTGNAAWGVPAYNGALFAPAGFAGAEVLERASIPDAALAPVLGALGHDEETGAGIDFSSLAIGHLGHIYEGLLALRLSRADSDMAYEPRRDRYVAAPSDPEVRAGELLWLTDEGGRKGGGVYYTPEPLVRHLVRGGVLPAFEEHLAEVGRLAARDPAAAARTLWEFRVLDPACGSAHFLVAVCDELADRVARFLGRTPLPAVREQLEGLRAGAGATYGVGVEDVALLRRLVLKRCVYGVDRSEMGAEIAKVSLWLATFVPGLALGYLDHNVRVGDSLVGVARPEQVRDPGERHAQLGLAAQRVRDAVETGAAAARGLLAVDDRTPDEVALSARADDELRERTRGARRLLDLWVAEPLGVPGARAALWSAPDAVEEGREPLVAPAEQLCRERRVLHWPLAFPEVFAAGGFDAVVGNPPWEEVTVEELAFYARYRPGLRGLADAPRRAALAALRAQRPELEERLEAEQGAVAAQRRFFAADTGYEGGPGDPDLYKFFCQRYRALLAPGGALAVVLPRSTFLVKGSARFRRWLFSATTVERLDFLLNRGRWAFDAEPRYTVALLLARATEPADGHAIAVAGVADSGAAFAEQVAGPGVRLAQSRLGPDREVPLLPSQGAVDLLPRLQRGTRFPLGAGRWTCFPVSEFHETSDAGLWRGAVEGRPLWKGESFDRFLPTGREARPCPPSERALAKQLKARPGQYSLLAARLRAPERAAAVVRELAGPRVAFRDVSRATDSRTLRAALVPPDVFLTNKAPYLAFPTGTNRDRAACLGLMSSLPFDWHARRYVETNVNFFILELLTVPELDDARYAALASAAARLSCPDERYATFAADCGVEVGALSRDERAELEVEVDAQACAAWGLGVEDLDLLFGDFSLHAVPVAHRDALRARLAELSA